MRLTVLVPVHNWDVRALLLSIIEEAGAFKLWGKLEVIVIDDNSSDLGVSACNDAFCSQHKRDGFVYSRLGRNVGRSVVRNLLAAQARGDFLLFLDCDVLPDGERFLRNYLDCVNADDFDVVCGGRSYQTRVMMGPEYDYHTYLGNRKEVKSASERNKVPWRFILTSNIMVRKSIFQSTPFDERFTGYGYEDIEWGVRLAGKCRILHIENTASHLGLVSKTTAYEKMCDSVHNYLLLRDLCPEAFAASAISKLVGPFTRCSDSMLNLLDRSLKRRFLECRNNRLAFILFQTNFAVLLARSLKDSSRTRKGD
ncbi:MAG: family 2 glycosyl transferase [Geobacteraceae bacterium GWC2_58_44]|nr:MAG: family 2 glycosyl transferase [Geobacteraceae bacterium GWC2_58_44]